MKKITAKNVFLVMLQLPLSAVLFACAFAEKYFTRWMIAIENPLSHPMTDLANKQVGQAKPKTEIRAIKQEHIRAFNDWLITQDDYFIDRLRIHFEAKHFKIMAQSRRQNPHLYAVLKPTRSENIMRIDNMFEALSPTTQATIIATALAVKGCDKRP